jgi:hypothetical protein
MQMATPRILAAEGGQRWKKDPTEEERGEEQRLAEKARGVDRTKPEGDGRSWDDADWIWIEDEHSKAERALADAMLQVALLRESRSMLTAGSKSEGREQLLAEKRGAGDEPEQQEQLVEEGRPVALQETKVDTPGAGSEPEQQEQLSEEGHASGVQEMEVELPVLLHRAQRTTNTSWAVGSNIAPRHQYLVQESYDPHRCYALGEEVAFISGHLRHYYQIAAVSWGTGGIDVEDLSGSKLELRHGPGQPPTWEQHGSIRQLYTQCSRRPGEVIGPRDMVNIRSHRPQTSMHWIGDMVAVPFIWATGQQGFRYAKVCAMDAATEASSKGLYQLSGGMHNPKMLRERGSFYAMGRHSPPRARLPEEDILEVPGRRGARIQEEWAESAQEQGNEPWSGPPTEDL